MNNYFWGGGKRGFAKTISEGLKSIHHCFIIPTPPSYCIPPSNIMECIGLINTLSKSYQKHYPKIKHQQPSQ